MNVSCNIIRDLLPLYAEELVSQDTRELVDEHLCRCDGCTKALAELKKSMPVPVEMDAAPLNKVKRNIRRMRILWVMTAVMLVVTIVMSAAMLLNARIYLPAEMAVEDVQIREDGTIRVYLSEYVVGTGSMKPIDEENPDNTKNVGIIAKTTLGKLLTAQERTPYAELPKEYREQVSEENYGSKGYSASYFQQGDGPWNLNLWYCNPKDGTGETLLWDAGYEYNGEPLTDVNYHIGWYCLLQIGLAIVFLLLRKVIPISWMRELLIRLAILCGCLSCSTVIVTAGQFMELWGEFTTAFQNGACLAVPMMLTSLFIRQIYLLNKQDKI